jgi:hypothetical protein
MSLKNSLHFPDDQLHLKPAWDLLDKWLESHQNARMVSPARVALFFKEREGLDIEAVLCIPELLSFLADQGQLDRKYAVQTPSGQLLFPYYDSRTDIPDVVVGTFDDERVYTKDAHITPIFTESRLNVVVQ